MASARRGSPVTAGYVFVDGLSVGEVGEVVLRDRRSLANDGMFMIVVTVDKQTGSVVGRPEIVTRGFVHLNEQDPIMEEAVDRVISADRHARRPHQRDRAAQEPDQGRAYRATCTSRRSAGRWSSRSWSRSDRGHAHAGRRRSSGQSSATRAARPPRAAGGTSPAIFTPEVVRSIVGTAMMALGAITLIALILPGQGALTDWWRDSIAPWFETGRWLLPFLLLGGGWYVAGGPGRAPGSGWGMTLAGLAIAYIAALGAFEVLAIDLFDTERGGGRIGRFLAGTLQPLLTGPGTFVLLAAIAGLGLMLAFNLQLRELIAPFTGAARWVGSTTADSMRRANEARPQKTRAAGGRARGEGRRRRCRQAPRSPSRWPPPTSWRLPGASSTSPRRCRTSRRSARPSGPVRSTADRAVLRHVSAASRNTGTASAAGRAGSRPRSPHDLRPPWSRSTRSTGPCPRRAARAARRGARRCRASTTSRTSGASRRSS